MDCSQTYHTVDRMEHIDLVDTLGWVKRVDVRWCNVVTTSPFRVNLDNPIRFFKSVSAVTNYLVRHTILDPFKHSIGFFSWS
jgi:hypothetical protein